MLNLSRKKLLMPFLLCMAGTLIMPSIYPEMRLFYLSPFIVMTLYRLPYLKSVISVFTLGLFLGIFSFETRFGLIGFILVLSTILVHPLKHYFFADRFYTLPLMTYLFASMFTLIQGFFFSTFSHAESPLDAFVTEALIMPLSDAIYAFTVFVLPSLVRGSFFRKWRTAEA